MRGSSSSFYAQKPRFVRSTLWELDNGFVIHASKNAFIHSCQTRIINGFDYKYIKYINHIVIYYVTLLKIISIALVVRQTKQVSLLKILKKLNICTLCYLVKIACMLHMIDLRSHSS